MTSIAIILSTSTTSTASRTSAPATVIERFFEARSARASVEAALTQLIASLPPSSELPARPTADKVDHKRLPTFSPEPYVHTKMTRFERDCGLTLVGMSAIYVAMGAPFTLLPLAAGLGFGLPYAARSLHDFLTNRGIARSNAAEQARVEARRAETKAENARTQPEREQQAREMTAWSTSCDAIRAARNDTVGIAAIAPLRRALDAIADKDLRAEVVKRIAPRARALVMQNLNELTSEAAAALMGLQGSPSTRSSITPEAALGLDFDHLSGSAFAQVDGLLAKLPPADRGVVAKLFEQLYPEARSAATSRSQ